MKHENYNWTLIPQYLVSEVLWKLAILWRPRLVFDSCQHMCNLEKSCRIHPSCVPSGNCCASHGRRNMRSQEDGEDQGTLHYYGKDNGIRSADPREFWIKREGSQGSNPSVNDPRPWSYLSHVLVNWSNLENKVSLSLYKPSFSPY